MILSNIKEDGRPIGVPNAGQDWHTDMTYNSIVGFVMLYDQSLSELPTPSPQAVVWRFMIDAKAQGQGVGRAALQLVIEHVRRKVARALREYEQGTAAVHKSWQLTR